MIDFTLLVMRYLEHTLYKTPPFKVWEICIWVFGSLMPSKFKSSHTLDHHVRLPKLVINCYCIFKHMMLPIIWKLTWITQSLNHSSSGAVFSQFPTEEYFVVKWSLGLQPDSSLSVLPFWEKRRREKCKRERARGKPFPIPLPAHPPLKCQISSLSLWKALSRRLFKLLARPKENFFALGTRMDVIRSD